MGTGSVLSALAQISDITIAALIIVAGIVIARMFLPIVDRLATAISDHMGDLARDSHELVVLMRQVLSVLETEERVYLRELRKQAKAEQHEEQRRGRHEPRDDEG